MARLDWPLVALCMMSPQESVYVFQESVYGKIPSYHIIVQPLPDATNSGISHLEILS